jgi:N6-L-threonylcarbamoyladenine synthase
MNSNVILAIETSCDDTCVAILKNNKVLADVIMSSSKNHAKFGGIVPEVAARSHEKNINICFKNCLKQSNVSLEEVTHIVYTNEPGLPGSLHIGKIFAKSLAYLLKVKLIPINHMHGHVFSCLINKANKVKFPFISFIASGGHTTIYLVNSFNDIKVLNQTNDDPIGEMLDKIGRVLKLPYPGGISIDKIYNFKFSNLKLINHNKPEINFSFSGLKTHILNYMNGRNMKKEKVDIKLVASSTLK